MTTTTISDSVQTVVLAQEGYHDSHILARDGAGWAYSERRCHSDNCACITHPRWVVQSVTEDEAAQILALFVEAGHRPIFIEEAR